MRRAILQQLQSLAHPMALTGHSEWGAEFTGTREQAAQCLALQGVTLPGEHGGPKISRTFALDGRKVSVCRPRGQVLLTIAFTADERHRQAEWEKQRDKLALLDRAAAVARADTAEQPATEAEFRQQAKNAFWRSWTVFRKMFLGSHENHASGFRYSSAAVDVLDGFAHALAWSLESDGAVLYDEAVRMARVREILADATKLDTPLQHFLEQVSRAPAMEEGGG